MVALLFSATLLLSSAVTAHPDHVEQDLLYHFAAGTHPIQNGVWQDKSHKVLAQVQGSPRFAPAGPTEGLLFTGEQYLSLRRTRRRLASISQSATCRFRLGFAWMIRSSAGRSSAIWDTATAAAAGPWDILAIRSCSH